MAGMFEVFVDGESHYRFRLAAPDGTVMAVSAAFDDKAAAVAGIAAVRECAGMGLVRDLCPAGAVREPAVEVNPAVVPPARHNWHRRADSVHHHARTLRRAAAMPRWTGAA
jgi:uncharacterized protein YegP (UPF0339 family)